MTMIAMLMQASAPLAPPKDLPVTPPSTLSAAQALPQVQAGSLFADRNLQLTLIVLFFGLLALVLLYLMVRHERAGAFELRIFIITILVFGSLLILSAGFGGDQLGPVIGFFGTIAGYVLGRGDRPSER